MNNPKDSLCDRMKNNYENRAKTFLVRRMPVIIRLDGKAFHTFTRGFDKPYDEVFHWAMNETLRYLCENIQGCKFGYTQSDEITLLLTDYDTLTTDAWFDNAVQKMCSISASMATLAFNQRFHTALYKHEVSVWHNGSDTPVDEKQKRLHDAYIKAYCKGAMFDSRCFNIPEGEVVNCFIWRQQDATRNAIQKLGQCNFSHKELNGKSCSTIQDMLMEQKQINFNDMPTAFSRGVCCYKSEEGKWMVDTEPPTFTRDRKYITNHLLKHET